MASTVWKSDDIARLAAGGVAIAPSYAFAAGVAWLARQLNAPVRLPERDVAWPEPAPVVVLIDAAGREVAR